MCKKSLCADLFGDANSDGFVDITDYGILVSEFWFTGSNLNSDFDDSEKVDIIDYGILVNTFFMSVPSPVPSPTQSPTPTPSPSSSPSPPGQTNGIWLSPDEIKSLPIAGQSECPSGSLCANAWNGLVSNANGNWGQANLSDYDGLTHSQSIFAGALVLIRCEDTTCPGVNTQSLRTKVLNGLDDVVGTEQLAVEQGNPGELLAPARQFARYVIVADLLGITDWENNYKGKDNYVDYMAHIQMPYAADGKQTFAQAHNNAGSNGNAMAGFSRIVSSVYLNDTADLNDAWKTFRRFTGDTTIGPNLDINDAGKTWLSVSPAGQRFAINPPGGKCHSTQFPADGAIPADQGRGGDCPGISGSPGYTQYPWEGIQGIFAQAEVFKRLGYKDPQGNDSYNVMEKALLRTVKYQWFLEQNYSGDWYDADRASWVKHLANYYYDFKPINYTAVDGGRNIGYTQWTHQK